MADDFLERIWAPREERVYPELFGKLGPGIFPLDGETFELFTQEPDPRWLFIGVFESEPSSKHPDWIYVSSGLSNPWEQDGPAQSSADALPIGFSLDLPGTPEWTPIALAGEAFALRVVSERFALPDAGSA